MTSFNRSSKTTPTPAQRAALDHGLSLGETEGRAWTIRFGAGPVFQATERDYEAIEALRDRAEAQHGVWRGWFIEAFEEGWAKGRAEILASNLILGPKGVSAS